MSNLIIGVLGTPWISQATWTGEQPRTAAHRRREHEHEHERERERARGRGSRR
jgi:hypothetical protein